MNFPIIPSHMIKGKNAARVVAVEAIIGQGRPPELEAHRLLLAHPRHRGQLRAVCDAKVPRELRQLVGALPERHEEGLHLVLQRRRGGAAQGRDGREGQR